MLKQKIQQDIQVAGTGAYGLPSSMSDRLEWLREAITPANTQHRAGQSDFVLEASDFRGCVVKWERRGKRWKQNDPDVQLITVNLAEIDPESVKVEKVEGIQDGGNGIEVNKPYYYVMLETLQEREMIIKREKGSEMRLAATTVSGFREQTLAEKTADAFKQVAIACQAKG